MNNETIQISDIVIEERQRKDLGDIQAMGESIKENGTILPISLERRKDGSLRLTDGFRRLSGCKLKGYTTLYHASICNPEKPGFVYCSELTPDKREELELEADVRRKDRTWQEKCIAIAKIHRLKQVHSINDSATWGQRETGELLGIALGKVNYSLEIARKLADKESPYWKCEDLVSAWRLRLREQEDELLAELARRHQQQTLTPNNEVSITEINTVTIAQTNPDALAAEREKYYSNPLNPPDSFDAYWAERTAVISAAQNTIYLSNRLILGDSIEHMRENGGLYDHILTDIPYAIDTDNMDQDIGALANIDTVAEEHDVDYNMQLIKDFFPAAFHCTKDNAFVITWCDAWIFRYMADIAIEAGFNVQRWPYHWLKPVASNSCAAYNQTKATEIAMICRKPRATLVHQIPRNYGPVCTSAEAKQLTGHPFAKPFELTAELADAISIEGQCILDPFCGRGSIILKLLAMKRTAIGVEMNVAHYNALVENVKQYYLGLNPNFTFK